MGDSFSDFFDDPELAEDDLLSIFESLESFEQFPPVTPSEDNNGEVGRLVSQKSNSSFQESESELESWPKSKRQKVASNGVASSDQEGNQDGQQRMSHITVERNRRKQMNEHLSILRSLMPCFYVKRGDQASIIGGVVDYINELQQILQSLEAKKQRKVYSEVLSPRIVSSPRVLSPLSPRKPPLSPRLNLPISPRTPTPTSPYRPRLQPPPAAAAGFNLSPSPTASSSSSSIENELVANSKSAIADVEVKFSGPNLVLKTVSPRIPGQAVKIISALEDLSLEILHVNVNTVDETLLNSFTIKIGIECQLSAEELAQQIQQTFC
ncbi:transcription factor SPEECHLESS-like [Tripterygium wilfordii]|uniref:transcription factor SPEECHLESS-like n=1 Tax=Tripterygium wilfordii TaxID=458696 RepID=UPI0018F80514|nr:transcription factor SPEECHLESS-like [Tripterygium wilfordii]